jgi:23S rRNA pseudouridine1911/1915/1917 synthase
VDDVGEDRSLSIPAGLAGERIDVALARLLGLSRTKAADLVATGAVALDGKHANKGDRVDEGQWLELHLPDPKPSQLTAPQPVDGLVIMYEDDDVVVVDKPAGVAAHPSPGWEGLTVIGGLMATGHQVATAGAAERQGIVHRLDVGTTGLMAVAKTNRAYTELKAQFKQRTVDKVYRALVQGHPDPLRGTIDAPIGRHPKQDWRMAVVTNGRPSITHYDTEEAFAHASYLRIQLETGRTHQIRVHMTAMRHPCVGDVTYGADPTLSARLGLTRQGLHAAELSFDHPVSGDRVHLLSQDPPDLAAALCLLRGD